MSADTNVSLSKIKIVNIAIVNPETGEEESRKLVVTKVPLGRYAQFFAELATIPRALKDIVSYFFGEEVDLGKTVDAENQAEDGVAPIIEPESAGDAGEESAVTIDPFFDIILRLPEILANHWNDLVGLLSLASGIDREILETEVALDEALEILMAAIEVNRFFTLPARYREYLVKFSQGKVEQAKQEPGVQKMTAPEQKRGFRIGGKGK